MPPKSTDKKGKKGARDVDLSWYARKLTPLPSVAADHVKDVNRQTGRILNIETLFPEWDISSENWLEPIPADKLPNIDFPPHLGVVNAVHCNVFFGLDADAAVDGKGKTKKDAKPAKGKNAVVEQELTEHLVNENGKTLPLIYKDDGSNAFLEYPPLKPFATASVVRETLSVGDDYSEATISEELVMDVRDPLICDAFRIIAHYAPSIVSQARKGDNVEIGNQRIAELHDNYLWRAIYPKTKSGKPCYNAAGKYCVRLFLAGKWRLVYVDGAIPVNSEGEAVLAGSADRYELWPMILSKAIYTVHSACGYSIAEVSGFMYTGQLPLVPSSPAHQSCQFLSFAMHLLTGWHPHQTTDAARLFRDEQSKSLKMIRTMLSSGLPRISEPDIVAERDECYRFVSPSDAHTDQADPALGDQLPSPGPDEESTTNGPGSPGAVMKTRRRFKEEYQQRRQVRDEIVDRILSREEKVQRVTAQIDCSKSEVFCIVKFHHTYQRLMALPILAIATPNDEEPDFHNHEQIQFLLFWEKKEPLPTIPNVNDPVILGKGRIPIPEFQQPFPPSSPLRCEWKSIAELMRENAFITALFTNVNTPFTADWRKHWQPMSSLINKPPEPVVATKGKRNSVVAAKMSGKDSFAAAPLPPDDLFGDPGTPQVSFMAIDLSDVTVPIMDEPEPVEVPSGEELREADEEAEHAESDVKFFNIEAPKHQKLGIQVTFTLHADIVQQQSGSAGNDTSSSFIASAVPTKMFRQQSWDSSFVPQVKVLPSDVVLLIQEVRMDDEAPLTFVLEMKESSLLPMVSKAFTIPYDKISRIDQRNKRIVFWLRCFTTSSLYLRIHSEAPVVVDLAELIWSQQLGLHSFVREGDAPRTVEGSEQLLFRLPLLGVDNESEQATKAQTKQNSDMPLESKEKDELAVQVSQQQLVAPHMKALVFLYISDRVLDNQTVLLLVSAEHGQSTESQLLPEHQGLIVNLSSGCESYDALVAYCSPEKQPAMPGFHWKLVVLAQIPFVEPSRAVQEAEVSQRFSGRYIANNKLRLFRDIYSVDKTMFPIALKVGVLPPPAYAGPVSDESQALINCLPLILRIHRKRAADDWTVVAEYSGSSQLHIYHLDLSLFAGDDDNKTADTGSVSTSSKAATKTSTRGSVSVAVETVEVLLECCIDLYRMRSLPATWTSRYPHVFDELYDRPAAEIPPDLSAGVAYMKECLRLQSLYLHSPPPTDPLCAWYVDILAGRVHAVNHDTALLVKNAAVKMKWEEDSAGQSDRASAAAAFVKDRISQQRAMEQMEGPQTVELAPEQSLAATLAQQKHKIELTAGMTDSLVKALSADAEDIQKRFPLLLNLPKVVPRIEEVSAVDLRKSLINPYNPEQQIGSEPWHEAVEERRTQDKTQLMNKFEALRKHGQELGLESRSLSRQRIEHLAEMQQEQRRVLLQIWEKREKYRQYVAKRNASLMYCLKRAKEAKQTVRDQEIAAAAEQAKLDAKKAKKK